MKITQWSSSQLFLMYGVLFMLTCISLVLATYTTTESIAAVLSLEHEQAYFHTLRSLPAGSSSPDIALQYPKTSIQHSYESIRMQEARQPPMLVLSAQDGALEELYTAVMVDIDAPKVDAPKNAPFLHYIVANLQLNSKKQGDVVVPYFPVSPPTGTHLYVVSVFQQQGYIDPKTFQTTEVLSMKRPNFDVVAFAKTMELTRLEDNAHISFYGWKPQVRRL